MNSFDRGLALSALAYVLLSIPCNAQFDFNKIKKGFGDTVSAVATNVAVGLHSLSNSLTNSASRPSANSPGSSQAQTEPAVATPGSQTAPDQRGVSQRITDEKTAPKSVESPKIDEAAASKERALIMSNKCPLHKAAEKGNVVLVNELLASGRDPNEEDVIGNTPLFYSVSGYIPVENATAIVNALIGKGADVKKEFGPKSTRRDAFRKTCQDSIDRLRQQVARAKVPSSAAGQEDDIRLLEWKMSRNVGGLTALFAAVVGVNISTTPEGRQLIETLLSHGADPNFGYSAGGVFPLLRVNKNTFEVAKLLLDHGADVNARDDSGRTILFSIKCGGENWSGSLDRLKMLVDRGGDVNIRDDHGCTILDYHFQLGKESTTKLLGFDEMTAYLESVGAKMGAQVTSPNRGDIPCKWRSKGPRKDDY